MNSDLGDGRRLSALAVAAVLALSLAGCDGEPATWTSGAPTGAGAPGPARSPGGVSDRPGALAASATGPVRPARTVSILGAGDILPHPPLWEQARRDGGGRLDFGPLLSGAAPTISAADLALCHLETPLAPAAGPYSGFPRFSSPPQIATAIRDAGYDGCSTASNHSLDQGTEGIARTLDALDGAGLGHAGTYRTAAESRRPRIYRAGGVPVGHLSYTTGFNGLRRPAGRRWAANLMDPARIAADARDARRAGAEIVVVSLHWGTEYAHQPDAAQRDLAERISAIPDIDLVFGHHAHVVQPVERRNGRWIVYGLGNQVARHERPIDANREGAMVRVTFRPTGQPGRWTASTAEAIPTWVDLEPRIRLVDLERALADPSTPEHRRREYRSALRRVERHLLARGPAGSDRTAGSSLVVRGSEGPSRR